MYPFAPQGRHLNSLGFQPQVSRPQQTLTPKGWPGGLEQATLTGFGCLEAPHLGLKPQAIQIPPLRGGNKATPRSPGRIFRAEIALLVMSATFVLFAISAVPAEAAKPSPREPWSAEQATGAPDTPEAEDAPTAWTPLEPDAGREWLLVRFARAVPIAEVRIRESLHPGAVRRVSASLEDGASSLLWAGDDPTAVAPADFVVKVERAVVARAVLIELDTSIKQPRRRGWTAIDAVELVGRDGSRQWAAEAEASSTYATVGGLLADELSPAARVYADEKLGIRMSAPGFWIRANPALLDVPGKILRAWTRDGTATVAVFRWEADPAAGPPLLADRLAAALASGLGAEIQAREVHQFGGLKAVGLVATGTGEGGDGPRIQQHWVAIPRQRDVVVLLLSTPEASFPADERTFGKMLATVEIVEIQGAAKK